MNPISKKRGVITTVGLVLAIAMIFSSLTLGNNMAKYSVYDTLNRAEYHIMIDARISPASLVDSYMKISSLKEVKRCNFIFQLMPVEVFREHENWTTQIFSLTDLRNVKLEEGRFPGEGEALISSRDAMTHGVSIGDTVTLQILDSDDNLHNFTVKISGSFSGWTISYTQIIGRSTYTSASYQVDGIFLSPQTLEKIGKMVNVPPQQVKYFVSLHVSSLIKSPDISEIRKKMEDVEYKIYDILYSFNASTVQGEIMVEPYPDTFQTIATLIFSLPVIVMGIYLTKIGIEIELYERRREFGIIRIRGATKFQRFKLVMLEFLIYSIAGGLVGFALGEFISGLSNRIFFHLPYFYYDVNIWYILSSVIISLFLFFIALYRPWKKISQTSLLELISHYSQTFRKVEYSKEKDIVWVVVLWGYLILGIYIFKTADFEGGLNLITIIAMIISFTFIFMFPLILVMLPLATSRLLTMGFHRPIETITRGLGKIFKVSGEIAARSLKREPRRTAYLAFIIAFLLTLSTFLSVTMDSQQRLEELNVIYRVGGDIKVYLQNNETLKRILEDDSLVKSVAYVREFSVGEYTLFLTDFKNYSSSVYHLDAFIKEGSMDRNGVGILVEYAKKHHLSVGDTIYVPTIDGGIREAKVSFIAYSFPGIPSYGGMADILMDSKDADVRNASYAILRAKNIAMLENRIKEIGVDYLSWNNVESSDLHMLFSFINTILLYLIILGAVAIFVVQYSLYMNRRGEIALYKVRGAKKHQLSLMLLTEGGSVILLALGIGLLVGFGLAYTIITLETSNHLPPAFTVGKFFALTTIILVGIYLMAQYLLSLIFSRVKVDFIIRSMGGEM